VNVEIKKVDEEKRTITAIGSKEIIDRDGDVIKVAGVDTKNYKKNPVVLWSHNHRELPIGKATGKKVWREGDELKFKIKFATAEENPKAEYVYNLYKGGYLNSFSIGFIPDMSEIEFPQEEGKNKKKKQPWRIFNKVELLEISAVPVPANAAAVMAGISKAWDDGTIDGMELDELKRELKVEEYADPIVTTLDEDSINKIITNNTDGTIEDIRKEIKEVEEEDVTMLDEIVENEPDPNMIKELEEKIKELEKKLEQSELTKEIEVDFNGYLAKLFETFEAPATDGSADGDQIEEDIDFEEYIDKYLGDK
jgi:HK97 family phage prohead protease